jgi:hypothetical protein
VVRGVFVGFSGIFLLEILIFKGLTARRLYTSFGAKGLIWSAADEFCSSVDRPRDSKIRDLRFGYNSAAQSLTEISRSLLTFFRKIPK